MPVFGKLEAPFLGIGKAQLKFNKRYAKTEAKTRMDMLEQIIGQLRAEYLEAKRIRTNQLIAEDAANAAAIRPAIQPEPDTDSGPLVSQFS
jgi:hypothetical protein